MEEVEDFLIYKSTERSATAAAISKELFRLWRLLLACCNHCTPPRRMSIYELRDLWNEIWFVTAQFCIQEECHRTTRRSIYTPRTSFIWKDEEEPRVFHYLHWRRWWQGTRSWHCWTTNSGRMAFQSFGRETTTSYEFFCVWECIEFRRESFESISLQGLKGPIISVILVRQ